MYKKYIFGSPLAGQALLLEREETFYLFIYKKSHIQRGRYIFLLEIIAINFL
ncbi:MAG: hypothetical protein HC912_03230 [Saprospiraceae bacterium]|nr:hypothetical protein [Saprospiraceae bacterium]